MAQTSWPFENIDTSETQFSQWARNIGEGVIQDKGNELSVYADGSGMNVKVRDGDYLARGHYYNNTGTETLTVTAADPSLPRIDSVVLRLDPTANSILLVVLAGAPNASPSAPALTQTDSGIYEVRLANVAVSAGAVVIAVEDVTDTRTFNLSAADLASTITTIEGDITTIEADLLTKAPLTPSVNAKTGAYTLVVGDRGEFITCDGTFIITIPSATFTAGDRVDFVNIGTGVITFAGSGVTVNSVDGLLTIDTQWAGATFFFTSSSAGVLIGKLA